MGLTIHYKGALKEASLIEPLAVEVMDIAEVMNWSFYRISHPSFDGIMLIPEGCEPLQLTFGRDGKLVSGIALMHGLEPAEYVFTKTQYAGIDVHMAIVRLLRYLTEKYFAAFEMVDESGFWEEEDEGKLRSQFGAYERVMDQVSEMVEAAPAPGQARGDEARGDELVKRLEAVLRERRA